MSDPAQLLRQIQEDAVSTTVPVSEVLRRCQILAARLKITELDEWVRYELNGYPPDLELPDYRICYGIARGHFTGAFGSGIRNAVLPARNLPKEYRQWGRQVNLRQPIATLQDLAGTDDISFPWPGDLIARVQHDFYEHYVLAQAWLSLGRSSFVGVIETVRNRILSFALDAEQYVTSDEKTQSASSARELSQVFHTTIYGDVGNLGQGSETIVQHSGVSAQDLSTLLAELRKIEVPSEDLEALRTAIADDGTAKFGSNVSRWMENMIGKAASGAWSMTLTTATTVLPKLLLRYYGLDPK